MPDFDGDGKADWLTLFSDDRAYVYLNTYQSSLQGSHQLKNIFTANETIQSYTIRILDFQCKTNLWIANLFPSEF